MPAAGSWRARNKVVHARISLAGSVLQSGWAS